MALRSTYRARLGRRSRRPASSGAAPAVPASRGDRGRSVPRPGPVVEHQLDLVGAALAVEQLCASAKRHVDARPVDLARVRPRRHRRRCSLWSAAGCRRRWPAPRRDEGHRVAPPTPSSCATPGADGAAVGEPAAIARRDVPDELRSVPPPGLRRSFPDDLDARARPFADTITCPGDSRHGLANAGTAAIRRNTSRLRSAQGGACPRRRPIDGAARWLQDLARSSVPEAHHHRHAPRSGSPPPWMTPMESDHPRSPRLRLSCAWPADSATRSSAQKRLKGLGLNEGHALPKLRVQEVKPSLRACGPLAASAVRRDERARVSLKLGTWRRTYAAPA